MGQRKTGESRRQVMLAGLALAAAPGLARAQVPPATYKSYALLARPADVAQGDLIGWLVGTHGPAAANIPGVTGCIVSEVLPSTPRADVAPFRIAPFHAVIETWFADPKGHDRTIDSAPYIAWMAQRAGKSAAGRTYFAEEHWYIPATVPRPATKGFGLLMRKADIQAPEFKREWIDIHGPMSRGIQGLHGFTESYVLAEDPQPGLPHLALEDRIDGFPMNFFGSDEETKAMNASEPMKTWRAHGATIFGKSLPTPIVERFVQLPKA